MKSLFDEIDDYLEEAYGDCYPLHPNRVRRGGTANKEMDGLFNVGAGFSAGFGSRFGRGYVIKLRFSTLKKIPLSRRLEMEEVVEKLVRQKLPEKFPSKKLQVVREGRMLKIIGDLSLKSF